MSTSIVASLIILTGAGPAPTVKDVLAQKYKQFNAAILKSDAQGATAWIKGNCINKFVYTSQQKTHLSRDGYISEYVQEISVTNKVLASTMSVRSIKQTGDEWVATVVVDFQGIVTMDSKKMKLSSPYVTQDTWKKVGKEWKFTSSKQVNSDLHVEQVDG